MEILIKNNILINKLVLHYFLILFAIECTDIISLFILPLPPPAASVAVASEVTLAKNKYIKTGNECVCLCMCYFRRTII